eukprot:gene10943-17057_t
MQDIIVMNQVSARDLSTLSKERERKQREIFVVVLERVYSRIKRCASVGMWTCHFEMPEMVFGYPMFDVERCIRFSMRHLVMNGFEVSHVNSTKMVDISWMPPDKEAKAARAAAASESRDSMHEPLAAPSSSVRRSSKQFARSAPAHGDANSNNGPSNNGLIMSIKRRPIEMQQPFRCIDSFVPHIMFPSR